MKKQMQENTKRVLEGLTDFQRATVRRVDELFESNTLRVLVADEAGLGKTLVARGVIAKTVEHCRDRKPETPVRIVYICSNAAIADQNVERLKTGDEAEAESSTEARLSMQHLAIFKKRAQKQAVELIPMTPQTSLHVSGGTGKYEERALIYAVLKAFPEYASHGSQLSSVLDDYAYQKWQETCEKYVREVRETDRATDGAYLRYMHAKVVDALHKKPQTEYDLLHSREQDVHSGVIKELRKIFAEISLDLLQPDLVILDEFQQFDDLIRSEKGSESRMISDRLFSLPDTRILLLSATPYRLYSTLEEIDAGPEAVDEEFQQFIDLMDFLRETPGVEDTGKKQEFHRIWENYTMALQEYRPDTDHSAILLLHRKAENALYRNMARTERSSETNAADLIDDTAAGPVEITKGDVSSYLSFESLLSGLGLQEHVPVDYVKSAPFLLSFLQQYKIREEVRSACRREPDKLTEKMQQDLFVPMDMIQHYEKLPVTNARLDKIQQIVFKDRAAYLLWIPPARPYYTLSGIYSGLEEKHLTKTLIFSSWQMVPRMLAGLLSYESERQTIGKLMRKEHQDEVSYFRDKDKGGKSSPTSLQWRRNRKGKPGSMNQLTLIYPSETLVRIYDPIECLNEGYTDLVSVRKVISGKLKARLDRIPCTETQVADQSWYYMAPVLLDDESYVRSWFRQKRQLVRNEEEQGGHLLEHLEEYEKLYDPHDGTKRLGTKPDDLIDVLCDMALASPAVCIRRTYEHFAKQNDDTEKTEPSVTALLFLKRKLYTPEATAIVRCAVGGGEKNVPQWKKVLAYLRDGCFQAVLDEYAHQICSGLNPEVPRLPALQKQLTETIMFQTSTYAADTPESFLKGEDPLRLRSNFAAAFTDGNKQQASLDRKKAVREAFNAPFRPFVLATTSIGQEGLDFHAYCRRIVHWNLPSNPVDLEQREGRINRYESLCIRQNVALRYGKAPFEKDNLWALMFERARRAEKEDGSSDLIPQWGLKESGQMIRIERVVPMYPMSRDEIAYQRLLRILSLYRMAMGQPRQEELLQTILQNTGGAEKDKAQEEIRKLFMNLSPFYRKKIATDSNLDFPDDEENTATLNAAWKA